ncbi:MAG: sulfate transporter CysZ [Pseudomonadales bacterium]|nr:sulfate transporter CysZ [Pseudomonadales bacterium]MBO6656545.1 sulfate transporter CysZ [Pseudomonadales bacterium]MBO6701246.1 sulfate transporter CysZ [Pseudomonadales bacterium]MBO7007107.1 sulfate transporter CysZ [Pseudomonadales bacterium]
MTGLDCFLNGFSLILKPGLRQYFVIPILINTVVLLLLAGTGYQYFNSWIDIIMGWFPDWMSALYWLVWIIALLVVLVLVLFLFTFIANIIASPFNALLSIKVEEQLTGSPPVSNVSIWMVLPRTIAREVMKLFYVIPRLLFLVILTVIPVVNTVSPFLWVLFGAWMMAIQYADYGADNNDLSFGELKDRLGECRMDAVMFGLPAYLLLTVPVVNLILMPVGVAGGTRFWVEHLR